ncbi:MAG: carbohydrate ABC transporter permease [Candidatus Limivivens sp.]|nr:carbohydrate ABC transporter permease [Candidatus Limivivens sp.]
MKRKMKKTLVYVILAIFAVIQIFPLVWLVNYSFKSNAEIYTKSSFAIAENIGPANYISAWVKGSIAKYFGNSVIVTLVSVAATLILACMMAYAITRMRWKFSNAVLAFLMVGMMIPIHATLIPLFVLLQKIGLYSTRWSLIIPYTAVGLPLAVFIFSNFLRSIPHELEEAAFIDGCSVVRAFAQIILPSLKPAIATVAIFTFMSNWNEFIMASTYLQKSDLYTLPLGLTAFQGTHGSEMGPMAAAILIASVPLLIFYCIFSEQVEKSFTAGAVLK